MPEDGWLETDSEIFATLGEVFVPGREEILRTILDHVPAAAGEAFLAVDIGCGGGWLSGAVLERFPGARVLALDGSSEMLQRAGELLAPYKERVGLRAFRLEDPDWPSGIGGPVRCFVSSLVLHHLDGKGKRGLFGKLLEKLEPGGALLYADLVEPRSEIGRRHLARAWNEETKRRSLKLTGDERAYRTFAEQQWNWYEHPDPMDQPSSISEQLRWLEEAGFEGVDVPWARAGHAVFCAYSPER